MKKTQETFKLHFWMVIGKKNGFAEASDWEIEIDNSVPWNMQERSKCVHIEKLIGGVF